MTHLSRAELTAWRDRHAPEDRDHVLSHLASCAQCAAEYALLLRTAPAGAPAHFRAEDFVSRGYAVRRRPSRALTSWKVWAPALAIAAALVVVVSLGPGRSDDVRGTRIQLVTPVVRPGLPAELHWSSGISADKYTVEVKDPAGAVMFDTTTAGPSVTMSPVVSATLQPGRTYSWTVSALDADGRTITSSSGTFSPAATAR